MLRIRWKARLQEKKDREQNKARQEQEQARVAEQNARTQAIKTAEEAKTREQAALEGAAEIIAMAEAVADETDRIMAECHDHELKTRAYWLEHHSLLPPDYVAQLRE